jgi:hypothetical protein
MTSATSPLIERRASSDKVEEKRFSAEKPKRTRSQVGRFMESLSEGEIAELQARLMADDGEIVPLDQLIAEQEEERRSRR